MSQSLSSVPLPISPKMEASWKKTLAETFEQPYFRQLKSFLLAQKNAKKIIYPAGSKIFAAFDLTPWDKVKVVILGQDPYHGAGQAHGLAFSVPEGVPLPPSLQNIYKELQADLGVPFHRNGNLTHWADQGVLLLNTVLTVEAGQAHSHRDKGWEIFTDYVIQTLSERKKHLVFVLWGAPAQKKEALIDHKKHCIIKSPHPSPLSAHRGFLGSRPFSQINHDLEKHGETPIKW